MTLSMSEAVVPKEKEFVAFEDDIAYALMELWEIDHGDATGVMWCHVVSSRADQEQLGSQCVS